MSKGKQIALWVLTALLAFVFISAGAFKLSGAQLAVDNFRKWGYPDWFRVATGIIEVSGALLLLVPRAAWLAAALLSCTMIGAAATHIHSGEFPNLPLPIVLLLLLIVLGWARRPQLEPRR